MVDIKTNNYLFDIYGMRKLLYLNYNDEIFADVLEKYVERHIDEGMELTPSAGLYYRKLVSIVCKEPYITLSEIKPKANILFSETHSHTIYHILNCIVHESASVFKRFFNTERYIENFDDGATELHILYHYVSKITTLDKVVLNWEYSWFLDLVVKYNTIGYSTHSDELQRIMSLDKEQALEELLYYFDRFKY